MRKRLSARLVFTAAITAALTSAAVAGDGWTSLSRLSHHQGHDRSASTIGYTTPVRHIPGVGTFTRSVWSIRTTDRNAEEQPPLAPKAKIIHVRDGMSGHDAGYGGCSYEAGVCVIRARN